MQPEDATPPKRKPNYQVFQMANIHWVARCLHVAAKLGIADLLKDETWTYEDLGRELGVNVSALRRLLRCLSAHEIFFHSDTSIRNNEHSSFLRNDHPGSLSQAVKWAGSELQWEALKDLEDIVRNGQSPLGDGGLFQKLQQSPNEGADFDIAMERFSNAQVERVMDHIDFSKFSSVCDIGGGRGSLVRAILKKYSGLCGIVFDLPSVIDRCEKQDSSRMTYISGDFFESEFPASDAYTMKHVLHDWGDADVLCILDRFRKLGSRNSDLFIIESLASNEESHTADALLDLAMFVLNNGKMRSVDDLLHLISDSGLTLVSQTRVVADLFVIQCRND